MSEWRQIDSAPHDCTILVFGKPSDVEGVRFIKEAIFTAYWDDIDSSFCLSGASWLGPFIRPTHWMPVPPSPQESAP
jgi:hypothetical protein